MLNRVRVGVVTQPTSQAMVTFADEYSGSMTY